MPFHDEHSTSKSSATNTLQGRRVALVIGNGRYSHATQLTNPANDAEAMSSVLGRLGFKVFKGTDLRRDDMEDELGKFEVEIGGADTALLFFAGHGLQVKGHNYLVPIDAEIKQEVHLKRRAFGLDEILDIMLRRARSSLIFLDACRDNPFARSLLSGMSTEEKGRYIVRGGLAKVEASQGAFIAYATAPDNVALDGRGNNSPFTEALLANIEKPGLSVSDMMIAVRNKVLELTGGRQRPWDQSSLLDRFCFLEKTLQLEPEPLPVGVKDSLINVSEQTIEHTRWITLQKSDSVGDLEAFIRRFPKGEYVNDARRLIEHRINEMQSIDRLERFVSKYPDSRVRPVAERQIAYLHWQQLAAKSATVAELQDFLLRFPESSQTSEARSAIADLAKSQWQKLKRSADRAAIQRYVSEFEGHPEVEAAIEWLETPNVGGVDFEPEALGYWSVVAIFFAALTAIGIAIKLILR